jgi:heme/copper-type cytochrome/quinol oxidase subunit 2
LKDKDATTLTAVTGLRATTGQHPYSPQTSHNTDLKVVNAAGAFGYVQCLSMKAFSTDPKSKTTTNFYQ